MKFVLCVLIALAIPVSSTQAATLEDVVKLVTEVTKALPDDIEEPKYPNPMNAMTSGVWAYSRFYWTADTIESSCSELGMGQRSEIEMVRNDIRTPAGLAEMEGSEYQEAHPNHRDYLEIYNIISQSAQTIGVIKFCGAMYKMLGPNGTLLPDVMKLNNYMKDDDHYISAEDGALWMPSDYCSRGYYLNIPDKTLGREMHGEECEKAKSQVKFPE